jgi:hypothetical protein
MDLNGEIDKFIRISGLFNISNPVIIHQGNKNVKCSKI